MQHLLSTLLPLGLAASVSPMMLSEQTVLLAGANGRRSALAFAAGAITVAVGVVTAVLVMGRRLDLPAAPHLSASLDVVIGVGLLAGAGLIRWRPRRQRERRRVALAPAAAYGFGLFSMATNFTTLALMVPAAKDISTDDPGAVGAVAAALLLVAMACLPAWGPVALVAAAPTAADRVLAWLQRQIEQHGRLVLELILLAAGIYLVLRGVVELTRL